MTEIDFENLKAHVLEVGSNDTIVFTLRKVPEEKREILPRFAKYLKEQFPFNKVVFIPMDDEEMEIKILRDVE